jgi:hypothetical protein
MGILPWRRGLGFGHHQSRLQTARANTADLKILPICAVQRQEKVHQRGAHCTKSGKCARVAEILHELRQCY